MHKYFAFLLCFITGTLSAAIVDDFNSYDAASFPSGTEWKEQAYGAHPSAIIAEENGNKFMQGAGSGDRRVFRHFPKEEMKEILAKNIFMLEFKGRGNPRVEIGALGKYAGKERFSVRINGKMDLAFKDQNYTGITSFNTGHWNTYRVIFEKAGDDILVSTAYKLSEAGEFQMDAVLRQVKFPASLFQFQQWNGIGFRIDGPTAVDDILFAGYDKNDEISGAVKGSHGQTPFTAILDHVTSPRQARDLSGIWSYAVKKEGQSANWQPVLVPDHHTQIMAGAGKDSVLFKTSFELDQVQPDKLYQLMFERANHRAVVQVNGKPAGEHEGGFFPFMIDISKCVKEGANELIVEIHGPKTVENLLQDWPQGWNWYYPLYAGIPYPIHLEIMNRIHIGDIFVKPRNAGRDNPVLQAEITLINATKSAQTVSLSGKIGDEWSTDLNDITISAESEKTVMLEKAWAKPRLWWPHDPHLYKLELSIPGTDAYIQEFGFREIAVEGHQLVLNGVPFMHRRSSPIIYWPLTAAENGLRNQYELQKSYGINGGRLHSSANLRAIREADRCGFLLSPESGINEPRANTVSEKYWPNAEQHLRDMVKAYRNNPSVIYWCISNEFAGFYMKGTAAEKLKADEKMMQLGKLVENLDPTRIWTASGDGSLGGGPGKPGPAPTLSFHYAWQPVKAHCMLPNSVYWLEEKLRPWQGIIWDKSKPLMLSEDMHPPYCLAPPHGMAWYAGNAAYDYYHDGITKAWYDAYFMLVDGYYFSEVAVWNPWATAPTTAGNELYKLGQLMPDFHIALRKHNTTAFGGGEFTTPAYFYNQTFKAEKATFTSLLKDGGNIVSRKEERLNLEPGKRFDYSLSLPMPVVKQKTALRWQGTLTGENGRVLAEKTIDFSIYPTLTEINAPAGTALYDPEQKIPSSFKFDLGRYKSLAQALAAKPANLVFYESQIRPEDGKLLDQAVKNGINVLIFELNPDGWKPIRCDKQGQAAFAFVRAPHDPVMKNITSSDLKLWGAKNLSVHSAIPKPASGNYDISADCGSGQGRAAILRLYRGYGNFLICQLPAVSQLREEPAAGFVLGELIREFANIPHKPIRTINISVDRNGALANALKQLEVNADSGKTSSLMLADGSYAWSEDEISAMKKCLDSGGTLIINELTPENLAAANALTGDQLQLEPSKEWSFVSTMASELDGIANADLYWVKNTIEIFNRNSKARVQKSTQPFTSKELPAANYLVRGSRGESLLEPSAAAVWNLKRGKVVVCNLLWKDFVSSQKQYVARFIGTVLRNQQAIVALDKALPEYIQLDISTLANRGFWHQTENKVPGWFGQADDDMRYFPVNVTGIDPVLKLPQPKDEFPETLQNFSGIDFRLVNPEKNNSKSCIVMAKNQSATIPVNRKSRNLWFLGAAAQMLTKGADALEITWRYQDGSTAVQLARGGIELQGYHYVSPVENGSAAWIGPNPSRTDAVIWVWPQRNPQPEKTVKEIVLKAVEPMAVVAVTNE